MNYQQTEVPTSSTASQEFTILDDIFAVPAPGVHLYFRGGSRDETSLTITHAGQYLFGRDRKAAIRFDDGNLVDRKVSHQHAFLHVEDGQVTIVNCSPRNGLKVDGVRLEDFQKLVLRDSDVITLGTRGPIVRVRIGVLPEMPR